VLGATFAFSGAGVTSSQQFPGNSSIQVAPDAPFGMQSMTVTTPAGSTGVCGSKPCTFTVVQPGSWSDVSIPPGFTAATPVTRLPDGHVLVQLTTATITPSPACRSLIRLAGVGARHYSRRFLLQECRVCCRMRASSFSGWGGPIRR
jgi:hypothetical protein